MPPIEAKISFLNQDTYMYIRKNQDKNYQAGDLNITLMGDEHCGMAMVSRDLQKEYEIISVNAGEIKEKVYEVTTKYCKKETVNLKITGK